VLDVNLYPENTCTSMVAEIATARHLTRNVNGSQLGVIGKILA
jgi:hypothetical protein